MYIYIKNIFSCNMFGKAMVHIAFIYEICRVVLSNTQRRSKVAMENPIAKRMVSMGKLYILYIYIYICWQRSIATFDCLRVPVNFLDIVGMNGDGGTQKIKPAKVHHSTGK